MQVTIGIPSQGLWVDQMGLSLAQTLVRFPYDTHFSVQRGPYLGANREACVAEAVAMKSDVLVFVDTDMAFPPDAMVALIERGKGKDIIGGNYNEKKLPPTSTVKPLTESGEIAADGLRVTAAMPTAPFQVGAVATGFMAIDLKRLTQCMAPPYFGETVGEDVTFCLRARKAGLQVWCDPTIPLKHIGPFPY